jgi:arabinofuranan 3-O-arabinosyltransferase
VRIGLKSGFRNYELPALGCALALFLTFTLTGEPTGFAINMIVGGLILRRAGPWWRRVPVPSLANAGA